jgi:probable HAF family extracellular repeat protein
MEEPMNTNRWIAGVVAWLCLAIATGAGAQSVTFTTIDFPGAVSTNARGINALGDIVGWYTDTAGGTHGFLLSGGHFRSIDFPGAQSTQAWGIGPTGDIVGSYLRPGESGSVPNHGFLMTRRGGFFKVDYPGHQNTVATRILPDGTVIGCYHDTDTMMTMHGFMLSRRGFDSLPEPTTQNNGATPDGQTIVGFFTDMMDGRTKGYVVRRGAFSPLEVPGSTFTTAWDVNAAGLIVGIYRDAAGAFHGFQYDGQTFGRIDVPAATATRIVGVNSHGDMVGFFVDAAGRTHGFLAQRVR